MKKFIAHGAIGTVVTAVALVPFAGTSYANAPLQTGARAIASARQHASVADPSSTDAAHSSRSSSELRAGYWEGFRDGYGLGRRHQLSDDSDQQTKPESYWDGYRLGQLHQDSGEDQNSGEDAKNSGYQKITGDVKISVDQGGGYVLQHSEFHNGYFDGRHHHKRHHHKRHDHKRHDHKRRHHKRCLFKELLGI